MVQNRPVQSRPFISNLSWGAFRYPTDIDFRSNHTPKFTLQRLSLPDFWQWTHSSFKGRFFKQNSYFARGKVCLWPIPMCLEFHDYPRNENRGEKVQISTHTHTHTHTHKTRVHMPTQNNYMEFICFLFIQIQWLYLYFISIPYTRKTKRKHYMWPWPYERGILSFQSFKTHNDRFIFFLFTVALSSWDFSHGN